MSSPTRCDRWWITVGDEATNASGGPLFVIGGQRCGTTSLYAALDAHPDISMAKPIRPEPKLFLDPGAVGVEGQRRFAQLFDGSPPARVLGEKATTYIERPDAAARIASTFPDARVVSVLRNPIDRAISNYWFSKENGYEQRPIEIALDPAVPLPRAADGVSASPFAYLARGRYEQLLAPWLQHFGPSVLVLRFEDVVQGRAAGQVFDFLDLDRGAAGEPVSMVSQEEQGNSPVWLNASTGSKKRSEPMLSDSLRGALEDYFAPTFVWMAEVFAQRSGARGATNIEPAVMEIST